MINIQVKIKQCDGESTCIISIFSLCTSVDGLTPSPFTHLALSNVNS